MQGDNEKRFFAEAGAMSGGVGWDREAACYTWRCIWGCYGFDCESADEAESQLRWHDCGMGR